MEVKAHLSLYACTGDLESSKCDKISPGLDRVTQLNGNHQGLGFAKTTEVAERSERKGSLTL